MNIEGGFPEILANGFSIDAGRALSFDAATAKDGLRMDAAFVGPGGFRFGFELCSPPGEETETGGVSFAVFDTT